MDLSCYLYKGCCQLFLSAENAAELLQRVGTLATVFPSACYLFPTLFPGF